jgi:hypothetical protein
MTQNTQDMPQACIHDCAIHGQLCELDANHHGDHECQACPGYRARQRSAMIAERVATHQQLRDLVVAPDED